MSVAGLMENVAGGLALAAIIALIRWVWQNREGIVDATKANAWNLAQSMGLIVVALTVVFGGTQGPPGPPSLAAGAVVAFDLQDCPEGWGKYEKAYGRFIRGIDPTGSTAIDPDGERDPGSLQPDKIIAHRHPFPQDLRAQRNEQTSLGYQRGHLGPPVGHTLDNEDGATETRPKNVALLFCEKE